MIRGMITSIDTVTQVSIKFLKKQNSNKSMVVSTEHNTNNTYENGEKTEVPVTSLTYPNIETRMDRPKSA